MKLEQTERSSIDRDLSDAPPVQDSALRAHRSGALNFVFSFVEKLFIVGIVAWATFILSTSAIPADVARQRMLLMASAGLGFDLVAWEIESLSAKFRALITRPGAQWSEEEATQLVREYMARAIHIGHMEREVEQMESRVQLDTEMQARLGELQSELAVARLVQDSVRPTVEDILERQVSWAIAQAGLGIGGQPIPPVKFGFTEPPRIVIVSPRDRIATIHSRMVRAGLPLSVVEQIEARINAQEGAVGYVSNIGGLGAYPAMVVDRSNLRWVISTIAHEWAHNYLTFFPLGLLYFGSGDLRTMNETVADIVGEEIGLAVLRRYYPDLVPPDPPAIETEIPVEDGLPSEAETQAEDDMEVDAAGDIEEREPEEAVFDFRAEMRQTRLEVDRLLAEGRIEEAEQFMEERRLVFVENGYGIRVLNQAYFAFHGSYATGPAGVSPIGPKMEALRAATPDLPAFLQTVRWFTSQDDLDAALDGWLWSTDP